MRKGKMTENKMEPRAKQICKLHILKIYVLRGVSHAIELKVSGRIYEEV